MQFGLWVLFGFSLLILAFSLSLANFAKDASLNSIIATLKGIAVFLGFLVSGEVAILAKKYLDLMRAAERAYSACAVLRESATIDLEAVRAVTDDYGIACLQCPPIPSRLFLSYQDAINKAYGSAHPHPNEAS
jgi:hypothetical protein